MATLSSIGEVQYPLSSLALIGYRWSQKCLKCWGHLRRFYPAVRTGFSNTLFLRSFYFYVFFIFLLFFSNWWCDEEARAVQSGILQTSIRQKRQKNKESALSSLQVMPIALLCAKSWRALEIRPSHKSLRCFLGAYFFIYLCVILSFFSAGFLGYFQLLFLFLTIFSFFCEKWNWGIWP